MRYAPLAIAFIAGVVGIMTQYDILWSFVTLQRPVNSDLVTVVSSLFGMVGGAFVPARPRAGSLLMVVAVVGGLASAQLAYLAPAALFAVALAITQFQLRERAAT